MTHPPQPQSQEQEQPTNEPLSDFVLQQLRLRLEYTESPTEEALHHWMRVAGLLLDTIAHYRERAERAEKEVARLEEEVERWMPTTSSP